MKQIQTEPSAYLEFDRQAWCGFRHNEPLTLTQAELEELKGYNHEIDLKEVEEIYLPLSRLINLYVSARQGLHSAAGEFLGSPEPKVPYIIGVAGSVAVGKSTTSRILQALLSRWPNHPNVSLVTTDGFLYPNKELERLDLMSRKGFPESYDLQKLLSFLQDVKANKAKVKAPIYSHHSYDIIENKHITVEHPDILIVEGLNILQTGLSKPGKQPQLFVSDFFDFTIFVDAETDIIRQWFIDRLWSFCQGPFKQPDSYFNYLSKLTYEETIKFAEKIWTEINELNLVENILPFKYRAGLVLQKGIGHAVEKVLLRKI